MAVDGGLRCVRVDYYSRHILGSATAGADLLQPGEARVILDEGHERAPAYELTTIGQKGISRYRRWLQIHVLVLLKAGARQYGSAVTEGSSNLIGKRLGEV
jgi:hypothetical protein